MSFRMVEFFFAILEKSSLLFLSFNWKSQKRVKGKSESLSGKTRKTEHGIVHELRENRGSCTIDFQLARQALFFLWPVFKLKCQIVLISVNGV